MGERELLIRMLRIVVRELDPASADAILSWCREHSAFLCLPDLPEAGGGTASKKAARKRRKRKGNFAAWDLLRVWLTEAVVSPDDQPAAPLAVAGRVAALLGLVGDEANLLAMVVAVRWLRRPASLAWRMREQGLDPAMVAAEVAGLETPEAISRGGLVRLGLIELRAERDGTISVDPTDTLDRVLTRAPATDDDLIECLVGARTSTDLDLTDFAERSETVDLLRRILIGALAARAAGVNILLYGPPGTGKTELARALAKSAGADLYAVGEVDDYGDEPSRWDRLAALKLAQRLLADRGDAVLLFDEMEDLIGEVERSGSGRYFSRREGSKVFLNRLFETNTVPTLWTSNVIENVDPAFLRRMSFALKMDVPTARARQRIIRRIAKAEDMALSVADAARFADIAPEAVTVARTAIRSARLARGSVDEAGRVAGTLVAGLRQGHPAPAGLGADNGLDLDLYESRPSVSDLMDRLLAPGAPLDVSLLLTGPPGTGKTALAHHLARGLDRPLVVMRASDLLSKWVGEAEKKIAAGFAEAAENGQVLLFDEIDSLLFDRASATRSWEVSQVNELLTWMDGHPMPFLAATNHAGRIDRAAMRRFVFKIDLMTLPPVKAARAFERFFGANAPTALASVEGLTPGDFANVARQLRFLEDRLQPAEIVDRLAVEISARSGRAGRIGFHAGLPMTSEL